MRVLLFFAATAAAFGQLQFYAVNGTTDTAIKGSYSVNASVGDKLNFILRVGNSGSTTVTVNRVALSGQGFTVSAPVPGTIAPGLKMDLRVTFAPTSTGSYSANLATYDSNNAISASIVLVGSAIVAPTIAIIQSGQKTDIPSGSVIDFDRVQRGLKKTITVSIENRSAVTMTVKSMQITGSSAFSTANPPAFPLTLNPTETSTFDLVFAPSTSTPYSAVITLDSRTIPLTGIGFDPAFSPLTIVVDPSLTSSIQPTLSITLSQPAPVAASGTLTLGFQTSVGGADDSAVRFLAAGGRVLNFSFSPGDTVATIGTAKSAGFQTGTTAGTITFTANFQNGTVQATSKIQPQIVQIDSTVANRPNDFSLSVQLAGYDNAKSTGQVAFTFYDSTGATIPPGRIVYDATANFTQYFAHSTTGGLFSFLATFPVKGSASNVSAVDVELMNSVGSTPLKKLLFSPCVPVITTPCPNANGCPCT